MDKREQIAGVLFRQFNYTKDVDRSHPDWNMITSELMLINDGDLDGFYKDLLAGMSDGRNLERARFLSAVNAYVKEKAERLWREHDVEGRSKKFVAKIRAIAELLEPYGRQKATEAASRIDFWKEIKAGGSPMFDDEEIAVIEEMGGEEVYELGRKLLNRQISSVAVSRDHVEKAWKNVITKTFLRGSATPRLGMSEAKGVKDLVLQATKKISID